jgi:predicted anti-sigma-YlaC factor YlaD
MRCEELRSLLEAYRDGELDERTRAKAEAHLVSCHACAQVLEERDRFGTLLQETLDTAAPPELVAALHADARSVRPARTRRIVWLTAAPLAAAAVLAVLLLTGRETPRERGIVGLFDTAADVVVTRYGETGPSRPVAFGGLVLGEDLGATEEER